MALDQEQKLGMREHRKALAIVTFVSLSSFQYGLDFGIIGGLQAMVGFLEVRITCAGLGRLRKRLTSHRYSGSELQRHLSVGTSTLSDNSSSRP